MALIKMKVTYVDGRGVEVTVTPRARVATEQYVGGYKSENSTLSNFYAAWVSLNKSGRETLDFEAWLDQVADVEEVEDDEPDPTPAAPSAADSSE